MAEIIKIYKEKVPKLRFIGKCYTDVDRINGGFGHKWGEWFDKGWFSSLEKLGEVKEIENGYLGFMRCYPKFEYWIGMFLPPETNVPDGFNYIDLDSGEIGMCWIQGKENDGSFYAMHDKCLESLAKQGMGEYRTADDGRAYFFERYNCPRFTEPDKNGNIILDYGIYLA